ncbi:hypothetical protein IV01_02720 [Pseudomonas syringae]|uniref:Uncharacterized protein n=1 Tax=Pseudomonas syringae TaxID=317 RepID=A0A085VQM2_PSESX|nr:hypothetical protein IV01_02720 [Pseudomonas syringae]
MEIRYREQARLPQIWMSAGQNALPFFAGKPGSNRRPQPLLFAVFTRDAADAFFCLKDER